MTAFEIAQAFMLVAIAGLFGTAALGVSLAALREMRSTTAEA